MRSQRAMRRGAAAGREVAAATVAWAVSSTGTGT